jgi:hypothetical protein
MPQEPNTWKIRVTRPFLYAGLAQPVGAEFSVPYPFARELIANNKAERVIEPEPAQAPEPAPVPLDSTVAVDNQPAKAPRKAKSAE